MKEWEGLPDLFERDFVTSLSLSFLRVGVLANSCVEIEKEIKSLAKIEKNLDLLRVSPDLEKERDPQKRDLRKIL